MVTFLLTNVWVAVAVGLIVGRLLWELEVRCHPDDHPVATRKRKTAEQDRIWKDAK